MSHDKPHLSYRLILSERDPPPTNANERRDGDWTLERQLPAIDQLQIIICIFPSLLLAPAASADRETLGIAHFCVSSTSISRGDELERAINLHSAVSCDQHPIVEARHLEQRQSARRSCCALRPYIFSAGFLSIFL